MDSDQNLEATFQNIPTISAEQLILPANVLEQVERHAIRFSVHRELLLSRGRHLKRGLLLFGPPGTGKSLTVMYLLTEMRDRTKILLNGSSITRLEDACALARALQPATIVIDDVDLVAEERSKRKGNPILFELLNQMDGIADDADVLFILTTNRPEILEPAIASRPGRIDQAIMIPLPDRDCRARLFDLYAKGLSLEVSDLRKFVEQTEDASAAFIRELFRSASLLALEEGVDVPVHDRHFAKAMEMLKSSLTGKFLGWQSACDVESGAAVGDKV
jgi:SpoVK/Ycf46/Vps4 family AAA+-type ATPase